MRLSPSITIAPPIPRYPMKFGTPTKSQTPTAASAMMASERHRRDSATRRRSTSPHATPAATAERSKSRPARNPLAGKSTAPGSPWRGRARAEGPPPPRGTDCRSPLSCASSPRAGTRARRLASPARGRRRRRTASTSGLRKRSRDQTHEAGECEQALDDADRRIRGDCDATSDGVHDRQRCCDRADGRDATDPLDRGSEEARRRGEDDEEHG